MKIMSVDYGDVRTGLAVCDRTEFLASPVGTIVERDFETLVKKVAYAATKELGVGMVVVGLPRNMDGTEGARAQKSRKLGDLVAKMSGLHVRMWDERQTTITAAGFLSESGTFGKKRKAILDSVSASVILENYLAWRKNHPGEE